MSVRNRVFCIVLLLCLAPGPGLAAGLPCGLYLHDDALPKPYQAVARAEGSYALLTAECLGAEIAYQPFEGEMAVLQLPEKGDLVNRAAFRVLWSKTPAPARDSELTVRSHLVAEGGEQPFTPGQHYLLFGRMQPGEQDQPHLSLGLPDAQAQQGVQQHDDASWRYFSPLAGLPCWAALDQAQAEAPEQMLAAPAWRQYEVMLSLLPQSLTLQPLAGSDPPASLRLVKGAWPGNHPGEAAVSAAFARENGLLPGDSLKGIPFPLVYRGSIKPDLGAAGLVDRDLSLLLLSRPGAWRELAPRQQLRVAGIYEAEGQAVPAFQDPNIVYLP